MIVGNGVPSRRASASIRLSAGPTTELSLTVTVGHEASFAAPGSFKQILL
jgi:hypothetical protein